MAAQILTKWRLKWLKFGGGGMCTGYIMAVGKVSPEGEFRPLLFSHSWTTQRPELIC